MDLDGLTPAGGFVEFSWHSLELDGPWDEASGASEGAELVGVSGDAPTPADGKLTDAAQEQTA